MMANEMTNMDRAKAYVEASNAHDLERVEAMFAADAEYVSTGAGSHTGRKSIRTMMDNFFAAFSGLIWVTQDWHIDADGAHAFDFVMTGLNTQSGEEIKKAGHERIWINGDGLISRIEVRA